MRRTQHCSTLQMYRGLRMQIAGSACQGPCKFPAGAASRSALPSVLLLSLTLNLIKRREIGVSAVL